MLEKLYGLVEKVAFMGNKTWAHGIPLKRRWFFFNTTGEMLGMHGKPVTELHMISTIMAELKEGKLYCARRKYVVARRAGLNLTLPHTVYQRLPFKNRRTV